MGALVAAVLIVSAGGAVAAHGLPFGQDLRSLAEQVLPGEVAGSSDAASDDGQSSGGASDGRRTSDAASDAEGTSRTASDAEGTSGTASEGQGSPDSASDDTTTSDSTGDQGTADTASGDGGTSSGTVVGSAGTEGLDSDLIARYEDARSAAAAQGVEMSITSGKRTEAQQRKEFEEAVQRYGSTAEARRYVLPPERSAHVKGLAIDVGGPDAAAWLETNGWEFGLCRVYANETWHFEPVIQRGGTCPALLADASAGW